MKKKSATHPHGTYEEMPPISRTAAEKALKSKNKGDLIGALIRLALNDPEWRWVQERCLPFLSHSDPWVRGAASTSLGHLARIHRRLDLDLVRPHLERLANDPEMGDKARDALDDIRAYAPNHPMSPDITPQNMVAKLLEAIPELKGRYATETEWLSKDNNRLIYSEVLYQHIAALLKMERSDDLQLWRIFAFLETLLGQQSLDVRDIAEDAICQAICSDEVVLQKAQRYMGDAAKKYCSSYLAGS